MYKYVITYDLNFHKNYGKIIEEIKSFPNAEKLTESTWLISSSSDTKSLYQHFRNFVDNDDEIAVISTRYLIYGSGNNSDVRYPV